MADPRPKAAARRPKKSGEAVRPSINFHKKNLYLLLVAAVTVIIGYVLLASGNKDVAALLLVVGYLGVFPYAIIAK